MEYSDNLTVLPGGIAAPSAPRGGFRAASFALVTGPAAKKPVVRTNTNASLTEVRHARGTLR